MKIAEHVGTVDGVGFSNEMDFGISKEGLPLILNILRNKMYSNKPLAVIRELSSNAADAMVEAGKANQPIKVTLPNDLSPVLKIRDYGNALTPEQLKSIFVQYGASTKRGSNDYIGQMGIGAKSPFAYADSFIVNSYQDGICRSYAAFIDPSQVGKMNQLGGDILTTEENGLEVVVSILPADINRFINEAQSFFQFWKVRPIFEGAELTFTDLYSDVLCCDEQGGWIVPTNRGLTPMAIMGNVPYVIDKYSIDWGSDEAGQALAKILTAGVRMWVNIGDLEVSASRESLEYTPKTKQTIVNKLKEVQAALVKNVNLQIEKAATNYDAKILYAKLIQKESPLFELRSSFVKVSYKGAPITSSYFDCQIAGVSTKRFYRCGRTHKGSGRTRVSDVLAYHLECDSGIPFILNDIGSSAQALHRITPIIELETNDLGKKVEEAYLITITDQAAWNKWVKESGFDAPTINLSSLSKCKLGDIYPSERSTGSGGAANAKHTSKVFEFDYLRTNVIGLRGSRGRRSKGKASDYWQPVEVDLDEEEGVYVILDHFESDSICNSQILEFKTIFEILGWEWPRIIGIKTAAAATPPPNMKKINIFLHETFKARIAQEQPELAIAERICCKKTCGGFLNNFSKNGSRLTFGNSLLGQLISHYNEMLHSDIGDRLDTIVRMGELLHVSLNLPIVESLKYDLAAETAKVMARYPLFDKLDCHDWNYRFESWFSILQHYINLIDGINIDINNGSEYCI